jgi:hypothetical protein
LAERPSRQPLECGCIYRPANFQSTYDTYDQLLGRASSKDETACEMWMWPFYIVRLSSVHSEQDVLLAETKSSSVQVQVQATSNKQQATSNKQQINNQQSTINKNKKAGQKRLCSEVFKPGCSSYGIVTELLFCFKVPL